MYFFNFYEMTDFVHGKRSEKMVLSLILLAKFHLETL